MTVKMSNTVVVVIDSIVGLCLVSNGWIPKLDPSLVVSFRSTRLDSPLSLLVFVLFLFKLLYSDFNNGHIMGWSLENETYCEYQANYGGAYKAPEEFIEEMYSNEGVDTWALGHGIFGLLTGLFPYYRTFSHSTIRRMVMDGLKPFVDDRYRTRSMVEGRLVEIMEQCWEFYAADRPSVFDVVEHITETKRLFAEEQQEQEQENGNDTNNNAESVTRRQRKEDGTPGAVLARKETSAEILARLTSGARPTTQKGNTFKVPGL
jgi:hypothetical protein